MRVEVAIPNPDDPLQREVWVFRSDSCNMILDTYARQSRQSNRHKWKGDLWNSFDERRYSGGSNLPRPTEIPAEVIEAAYVEHDRMMRGGRLYIGWHDSKHEVKK